MSDDARAMRGGELSHDDAQALISARMDGPLDTERNRALLGHLAACPTCAAFAATMEGMAVGFREIPVLPPSPVVARAVRAEVRKTGMFRSVGRWLSSSRGLPLGALGAATVALVIVAASTFGPLAERVGGPQVAAPQASAVGGSDAALMYTTTTAVAARKATAPPNVEVIPTDPPPTAVVVDVTIAVEATATTDGAIEPRPTEMMMAAAVTEAVAEESATPEPTATNVPATDTPEPTATPAPPTATATATETATPEPTATGIIVVTSEAVDLAAEATVIPASGGEDGSSSPLIKPRDPSAPTVAAPADGIGGGEDAAAGQADGAGAADAQAIVSRGSDDGSDAAADADASGAASLAAAALEPLRYADLATTGAMYDEAGTLVASPDGAYLAVERVDGVFSVLSADGAIVATGYGYNPIWTDDGIVYTVDAVLAEGKGAMQAWDAANGVVDYVTGGLDAEFVPVFDVPAGLVGGDLWYVRYRPAGSPSLELRSLASDEPLWSADGVALVGQNVYVMGGAVYAPTDLGWLLIAPGAQAVPLGGEAYAADEVLVAPDGEMVAFVAGDRVLIAPATDPGSAIDAGVLGAGGIAWTPYGLAIADAGTVILVTEMGPILVVVDGDGLSAPVWTVDGLTFVGSDDEVRLIPEAEFAAFAGL